MSQQTQFLVDLIAHLASLVPGTIGAEFYAERIPDDASLPAGLLSVNNRDDLHRVGGVLSPLEFTEIEFETFGATLRDAVVLMDELLSVLNNFTGVIGSTHITKVTKTSDLDGYEDASKSYYRTVQLTIGHR